MFLDRRIGVKPNPSAALEGEQRIRDLLGVRYSELAA